MSKTNFIISVYQEKNKLNLMLSGSMLFTVEIPVQFQECLVPLNKSENSQIPSNGPKDQVNQKMLTNGDKFKVETTF
jgi:hypothetical protein